MAEVLGVRRRKVCSLSLVGVRAAHPGPSSSAPLPQEHLQEPPQASIAGLASSQVAVLLPSFSSPPRPTDEKQREMHFLFFLRE